MSYPSLRRRVRFETRGHTPGVIDITALDAASQALIRDGAVRHEYPRTLDLRRVSPSLQAGPRVGLPARGWSSFGVRGGSLRHIVTPRWFQSVLEPTEPREALLGFWYLGLEPVCFRLVANGERGSSNGTAQTMRTCNVISPS